MQYDVQPLSTTYRNHIIDIFSTERQTVYDIYESPRYNYPPRQVVAGFFQGQVDKNSLLIRLKDRVDKLMAEPPAVLPNLWSEEFWKD